MQISIFTFNMQKELAESLLKVNPQTLLLNLIKKADIGKPLPAVNLFEVCELLDTDGVTASFNFQHCWSSGWIAGQAIAQGLS